MAHHPPLKLTFGVELEFVLGYLLKSGWDRHLIESERQGASRNERSIELQAHDKRERNRIVLKLRETGLDVNDVHETDYARWTVASDGSVSAREASLSLVQHWANGTKSVLTEEGRRNLLFCDVEVKSRVLPCNACSFQEVDKVVTAIVKNFPVFVNESCGLHVHVGNQRQGFPLQTVKNLATLVTCFEKQFNQLHPLHRLQAEYSMQQTTAFEPEDRDPWYIAGLIDGFEDLETFLNTFGKDRTDKALFEHHWCYNFNNLQLSWTKKTIEFRQHAGSLDADTILRWVNFACALVALSHYVEKEGFWEIMLDWEFLAPPEAGWNVLKLFHMLHLPMLADMFRGHIYEHPANLKTFDKFAPEEEPSMAASSDPDDHEGGYEASSW